MPAHSRNHVMRSIRLRDVIWSSSVGVERRIFHQFVEWCCGYSCSVSLVGWLMSVRSFGSKEGRVSEWVLPWHLFPPCKMIVYTQHVLVLIFFLHHKLLTLYSLQAYSSHNPTIVSQTNPQVATSSLVYSVFGILLFIVRWFTANSANFALRPLYSWSRKPGWSDSRSSPASRVRLAIKSNSEIWRGNQCTSFSSNTSSLVVNCWRECRRAFTLGSSTFPWKSMKKSNLGWWSWPLLVLVLLLVTGRDSILVMLTSYFQLFVVNRRWNME